MSIFKISADIFLRLSAVSLKADEHHAQFAETMRGIRVENRGGVSVAVATCGRLIAVECLSECDDDGEVTIRIDNAMLALARDEAQQNGSLMITQAPGWTIAKGSTTERMYPLNAEIPGDYPDWRGVIPQAQPLKSNTAFILSAGWLARLAEAAPSQSIVLPKHVDVATPIVVCDKNDPNWVGIVLPGKGENKPAEIPDWLH